MALLRLPLAHALVAVRSARSPPAVSRRFLAAGATDGGVSGRESWQDKKARVREEKGRLRLGLAKNVGAASGPSPYVLGSGARSGLPVGCPAAPGSSSGAPPLFTVLGIETSCDDTGAAVVRSDGCVLGEALASQHEIHAAFGGVVPGLARDAHASNIDAVIGTALAQVYPTPPPFAPLSCLVHIN
jgi:hypothetical protein